MKPPLHTLKICCGDFLTQDRDKRVIMVSQVLHGEIGHTRIKFGYGIDKRIKYTLILEISSIKLSSIWLIWAVCYEDWTPVWVRLLSITHTFWYFATYLRWKYRIFKICIGMDDVSYDRGHNQQTLSFLLQISTSGLKFYVRKFWNLSVHYGRIEPKRDMRVQGIECLLR